VKEVNMDLSKIIARVQAILTRPKQEWPVIAGEQSSLKELYLGYIMVLAAIGPVAGFFKMTVIGMDVPFMGTYRMGFGAGLSNMVFSYAMALVGVYLVALIINHLAPTFGGQKNVMQALKTVAYSYTAAWIAGLGHIVPWVGMAILILGSVYSIYLLYLGLPVMMHCPREKAAKYTAASIVVALVVGIAISLLVGGITGVSGMMGGGTMHQSAPAQGGFDKDSPGGNMEEWAKKMESASEELKKAQESGDAQQQSEAMDKMISTATGNTGPVESLAPERIKAFLPEKLAGLTRSELSAERSGAMGLQVSTAQGTYEDQSGNGLQVEITDMAAVKGIMGLAGWVGVEQERVTETGYEKTYKDGQVLVHEQWDRQAGSGEYSLIVGERFNVTVTGSAPDIGILKNAARGIDLEGLAALKDEGVQ
jgi:hypothetical protein